VLIKIPVLTDYCLDISCF